MQRTRREFIRFVRVVLAAALTRSCAACYTPAPGGYTPRPAPPTPDPHWSNLRTCWLDLAAAELPSFEDGELPGRLRQCHANALQALVDGGKLRADIADEIAVAYDQAVAHIERQLATCYIALPPEFTPRSDLMKQADLLAEMAEKSDINPMTVAHARAALERDIAWLAQFQAGQVPGSLTQIEVDADSIEAARILVDLLLGKLE